MTVATPPGPLEQPDLAVPHDTRVLPARANRPVGQQYQNLPGLKEPQFRGLPYSRIRRPMVTAHIACIPIDTDRDHMISGECRRPDETHDTLTRARGRFAELVQQLRETRHEMFPMCIHEMRRADCARTDHRHHHHQD